MTSDHRTAAGLPRDSTLGEFISLQRGHDLPEHRRRPGGVPVMGSFGVTGYHDEARAEGPGVTIGRSGASVGVVCYSPQDYWPLNTCLYVTDFNGNDPRFAYYLLNSIDFGRYNSGSAQPSLNRNYIRDIPIKVPALSEQVRMASVLGALDDKIELSRRMNRTLESVARAIFKSWFVAFDPVRRKMEGGEVGLPPDVASLFPDSLEESVLGQLPAGWVAKTIEDVADRIAMGPFGSSIKVETLVADGVPVINGRQLGGLTLEDASYRFVTEAHADELSRANVKRGDIVLTHRGTLGQAAFIPESSLYERYVVSQSQFYMRCDLEQVNPAFIVLYFHSDAGRHALLANRSSSGVPSIARPATYLRSIRLPVPPKPVMDAFGELVTPLFELACQRSASNRTVASLRDALLPRLLDGRLSADARDLPNSMEASGPCLVQKHP